MKILRARKILREQRRAANRAGFVHEQTAVGLMRKKQLSCGKNHERIYAAQNDGKEKCRHNRATEFSKDIFHKFLILNYARCNPATTTSISFIPTNGTMTP